MTTKTWGGKRDNRKRRPDDKRGGRRIPGPGKTLGRPRKDKDMTSKRERAVGWFVAAARDDGKALLERGTGERARFISAIRDGDMYDVTICHYGMPAVEKRVTLADLDDEVYATSIL